MPTRPDSGPGIRTRYGIGEWYGKLFVGMSAQERVRYAELQARGKTGMPCPWRSTGDASFACNKKGGVCSIRLYEEDFNANTVRVSSRPEGALCATCPNRFYDGGRVFLWIGETLLNTRAPVILNEIGFLERRQSKPDAEEMRGDVGKIDHVVVHPDGERLRWCALEMQAVYFSGASMSREYRFIRDTRPTGLPFPQGVRRPDFRSSGPKRLMPQLQIKVPSLRRWGKKMTVVVDNAFFSSLGAMDCVENMSNCDIAWFVVRYDEREGRAHIEPDFVRFTTLERAVAGLTAGLPVTLETFEARIREKLRR